MQPSYRPWTPDPYQLRGSTFLQGQGAAVLWLDPGMRKTSIVLHAFDTLRVRGEARRMLVIAPKRVCQLVWRQEASKWEDFRHLRFVFLHGDKKAKLLKEDADVYLINPEGVMWLAKQFAGRPQDWPFDTVTIDELTKFKNSQAERHKALRGRTVQGRKLPNLLQRAQRRWGMTGTPNPNGYMDLFGQFLLLDDGAALGKFVTHYRDQYFSVGFNGFDYDLQPGAEKRIQARLASYVFCLNADDYIRLPELQDNVIEIDLEPEARAAYEAMRKSLIAHLGGETLEAANKAVAYSKLSQMAGGAVYMEDGSVHEIHTAKLDALSDLIDELGGQQLLVGYEFDHEKERLKARFGNRMVFLADARTDAQAEDVQRRWNAGQIDILACHPASAGHGLNLQDGNACHLCWFGPIWDLELWDQFIRRLRRSGNMASRVMRHILVVKSSIDELKLQALAEKDTSQGRLKRALETVLSGTETTQTGDSIMVMKLQRAGAGQAASAPAGERKVPPGWGAPKGDAGAPAQAQEAAPPAEERKAPAGWGKPAGAALSAAQEQREAIQEKLNPQVSNDDVQEGSAGFSSDVIALKGAVEQGADAPFEGGQPAQDAVPKATRNRSTASATASAGLSVADIETAVRAALAAERSQVISAPYEPTEEDMARQARYALEARAGLLNSLASAFDHAVSGAKALAEVDEGAAMATLEAFANKITEVLDAA